jgi:tetratricopeptide (TPR) repeat protein
MPLLERLISRQVDILKNSRQPKERYGAYYELARILQECGDRRCKEGDYKHAEDDYTKAILGYNKAFGHACKIEPESKSHILEELAGAHFDRANIKERADHLRRADYTTVFKKADESINLRTAGDDQGFVQWLRGRALIGCGKMGNPQGYRDGIQILKSALALPGLQDRHKEAMELSIEYARGQNGELTLAEHQALTESYDSALAKRRAEVESLKKILSPSRPRTPSLHSFVPQYDPISRPGSTPLPQTGSLSSSLGRIGGFPSPSQSSSLVLQVPNAFSWQKQGESRPQTPSTTTPSVFSLDSSSTIGGPQLVDLSKDFSPPRTRVSSFGFVSDPQRRDGSTTPTQDNFFKLGEEFPYQLLPSGSVTAGNSPAPSRASTPKPQRSNYRQR